MEDSRVATQGTPCLPGGYNVRDLGGLPTTDGGRTRRGRLLRSDLATLFDSDLDELIRDTGLQTVVDLRGRGEVRHRTDDWVGRGVTWIHCPLRLGRLGPIPGPDADFAAVYIDLLDELPAELVLAARSVMAPAAQPALFHCAAGKDRTGVLAALLLDALRVEPAQIGADYALSSAPLAQVLRRLTTVRPYDTSLADFNAQDHRADPETMLGFLDLLRGRHGGGGEWLLAQGVEPELLAAFRAATVAPDPRPAATGGVA